MTTIAFNPNSGPLQQVLNAASEGARIEVGAGTIEENLVISKPVTLVGGGPGTTILKGAGGGAVVTIEGEEIEVRLEGLEITAGSSEQGGGIFGAGFILLTLEQCHLHHNEAPPFGGGGLYLVAGELTARGCRFDHNEAGIGGAMLLDQIARADLEDCELSQNRAERSGGAIAMKEEAHLTARSCRLAAGLTAGEHFEDGGGNSLDGSL